MAESYCCNGEWVHFSNGACQELQLTWAKIAEQELTEPGMRELAKALKEKSKYATGVAAVGIDSEFLDDPFCRDEVKSAWLKTMKTLIDDISIGGQISATMDVNWSDELRDSWLERLKKMFKSLESQIGT